MEQKFVGRSSRRIKKESRSLKRSHCLEDFGVLGQTFAQITDDTVFRDPYDGTADNLNTEDGSNGSVCFAHRLFFIHQEREGEVMSRGKGAMRSAIGVIDSKDLQTRIAKILPVVADGAKLNRAAGRAIAGIKDQDRRSELKGVREAYGFVLVGF